MAYEGWASVELMGFVKTVGRISEEEAYGSKLLRVDRPVVTDDGLVEAWVTTYHGGSAIYRITPLSEDLGMRAARGMGDPRPVEPMQARIASPLKDAEFDEVDEEDRF